MSTRVGDTAIWDHEQAELFRVLEPVARENYAAVQRQMADAHVDAIVVNRSDNLRYLTGYGPYDSFSLSAEHGAVLTRNGPPVIVAAPRLATNLSKRHWLEDVVPFSTGRAEAAETFAEVLAERGVADGQIALDPHLDFQIGRRFGQLLPTASLVNGRDLLYRARAIKTSAELAIIEEGLSIAELGIETGIEAVEVGIRECEVAGTIMDSILAAGAAGAYALPAIVSSGDRWSRCQEYPSRKRIRRGEFVQLDEGPMWKGYYSELARMLFMGSPDDPQRARYEATYAAHRAAIDAIRPGATGADVYEAAQQVFAEYGFEEWLTDGNIGHGIGCIAHEPPFIGPDGDTTLEPNMVLMIEPGLFQPGVAGVRFEDMVLVTDTGREVLSRSPHPHHDKFT